MTLLLKPILLFVLLASLQADTGLLVRGVSPLRRPLDAAGLGVTVLEVRLNRSARPVLRVLSGEAPFVEPAVDSLKLWDFSPKTGARSHFASVTYLFRPAVPNAITIPLKPVVRLIQDGAYPAVPKEIVDPGYPETCLGGGAVVLEISVDLQGRVTDVNTISGTQAFVDHAERAVKRWRFVPAQLDGTEMTSTSYVVISFVRPLT